MKILQTIEFFTPTRGGSVNSVYNLSKELAKNGHDVTIITSDFEFDKEYAKSIRDEGVEVISFHCKFNIDLFVYSPEIKSWIIENIKRFDIVHMHNFRSYQNNIVSYYARKNNIPYILQAHGSVLPFFKKQILKKLYDLVWGNEILKNTTKVIALTKMEEKQYKKMGVNKDKIVIIPNTVDLSFFNHLPKKGTFREKYDISLNTKMILYLGRLHKIKGIDLLIDAFSELQKDFPFSKLIIAGPDEGCLKILQNQAEEMNVGNNIIFTGPLYGQDKLAAYIDANVYVLPSLYEAFPNTVLEAWACETPVIVTKECCISDIVLKAGLVVNRDKNHLKSALIDLMDDTKRNHFSNECKKVIREFELANVTKKFEKVYNETAVL